MPKTITILPGVRLHMIAADCFKSNYLSVNFLQPLKQETASLNALLPAVLGRGCEAYPTMAELNRALDDLYGAGIQTVLFKLGENQLIGFGATFLRDCYVPDDTDTLGGTIGLMGQMLFHPALSDGVFLDAYVESEKKNLCEGIRAKINNKASYALKQGMREMCRDEAFAIDETGTVADVEKITPAALYRRYLEVLETASVEIFFVGKADEGHITALVQKMFQEIHRTAVLPTTTVVRRTAQAPVRYVTEKMPVEQGKLTLGFRSGAVLGDGDFHRFVLFTALYGMGGAPTSKLFMNVREKLSLCYYCSCMSEPHKGLMMVYSGVECAKKEQAYDEILAQLQAVQNGEFTDEELDNARRFVCNSYRELTDSPEKMESWYLNRLLCSIDTSPAEAAEQIMAVTREEVIRAACGVTLDTVYFLMPQGGTAETEDEADG